jgi:hypothetical protein
MQSCGQGTTPSGLQLSVVPLNTNFFSRAARVADRVRDHPTATKRGRAGLPLGTISGFLLPPLGRNPRHGPERSAGLASHWLNRVVIDSQNAEGTSVARMASAAGSRESNSAENTVSSLRRTHPDDERPPIPGLAKHRFTNAAPGELLLPTCLLVTGAISVSPVMNSSTPPSKEPCYFLTDASGEQLTARGRTTSPPPTHQATATRQPGGQTRWRSATEPHPSEPP